MTKHTLKILRCEHRKIFKVYLAIFQHYEWKVNQVNISKILRGFLIEISFSHRAYIKKRKGIFLENTNTKIAKQKQLHLIYVHPKKILPRKCEMY